MRRWDAQGARSERTMRHVQHPRLTHPELDFWINGRLREFNGRWFAVADLADTPEIGTGETPEEALRNSPAPFGSDLAGQLVANAGLQHPDV